MAGFQKASKRKASPSDDDESAPAKKSKIEIKPGVAKVDEEGNAYWELSSARRIGISSFKSTLLLSIREYYTKDGKTLPGKKGISLSVEQYRALIAALPGIERALKEKGEDVPRPIFNTEAIASQSGEEKKDGADDNEEQEEKKVVAKQSHSKAKQSKRNVDATSDEDEE